MNKKKKERHEKKKNFLLLPEFTYLLYTPHKRKCKIENVKCKQKKTNKNNNNNIHTVLFNHYLP